MNHPSLQVHGFQVRGHFLGPKNREVGGRPHMTSEFWVGRKVYKNWTPLSKISRYSKGPFTLATLLETQPSIIGFSISDRTRIV